MAAWWQRVTIYQVLVPSFQDANDDGTGDLPGIVARLDHLEWLGVGAIWLSPLFDSPMKELGYDVSDYTAVNPRFGTLDDVDALIAAAHARGIKVILDWIPNHTSSEHPWFQESRSARDSARRDWYLWRDGGPEGGPPNNWVSVFGGSAWDKDDRTGQYYCHSFLPEQPDLNWRHPDVAAAVHDAMRFWLRRGVDGFRVDAVSWMAKDEHFRDNPVNPQFDPERDAPDQAVVPEFTQDQPYGHEIAAGLRAVVDEFDDRVLLGELYVPTRSLVEYAGSRERPELHLPLPMPLAWLDWTASQIGAFISEYAGLVPDHAWPAWILSTHDTPRRAARTQGEQTRIAAMLLLTLRGTPVVYYGEEIGMVGTPIPPERARDPQGRRIGRNRDPERTPMQWSAEANAGFSKGEPWLPIGADAPTANVAAQRDQPVSLLSLHRRLIAFRTQEEVLAAGGFEVLSHEEPVLAYVRTLDDRRLVVLLNFSGEPVPYHLAPEHRGRVRLSTWLDREHDETGETAHLRPHEGLIIQP